MHENKYPSKLSNLFHLITRMKNDFSANVNDKYFIAVKHSNWGWIITKYVYEYYSLSRGEGMENGTRERTALVQYRP
jgi:hypothetical protein